MASISKNKWTFENFTPKSFPGTRLIFGTINSSVVQLYFMNIV